HFVQAADEGSLEASQFLVYNYGKESLIDAPDEQKAQHFAHKIETAKEIAKNDAKKTNKYFSDYYFTYDVEVDVDAKVEKLKALRLAKDNVWYQQVLDELNSSPSSSSSCDQYPLPEDSALALLKKTKNETPDKTKILGRVHLFNQAMNAVKSQQTIEIMLRNLCCLLPSSHHEIIDYSLGNPMLQTISNIPVAMLKTIRDISLKFEEELHRKHNEGVANYPLFKNILRSLTSEATHGYYYRGNGDNKSAIVDTVVATYPVYALIDQQEVTQAITKLLDGDIDCRNGIDHDFLRLLALLPHDALDEYVTTTLQKKSVNSIRTELEAKYLPKVIEALYKNPETAQKFNGTSLALETLAQTLLHPDAENIDTKSLATLFTHGDAHFYQTHLDEIIAVLPQILKSNPSYYNVLTRMTIQQDLPTLQEAALQNLLACNNIHYQASILGDLLENENLNEDQRQSLYPKMNTIYQEKKYIMPLQCLWMYLKDDPAHRIFLYDSIVQYFNLSHTIDSADASIESIPNFFNKILKLAREQATLPHEQFSETIKFAHQTDLASIIDPDFLNSETDMIILNDQLPFEQRAICLDQRLVKITSSSEAIDLFQKIYQNVTDEEFKTYAHNILITIIKMGSSSFEMCKAKKIIRDLDEKYKVEHYSSGNCPLIVGEYGGGSLSNYSRNRYDKNMPDAHLSLTDELSNLSADSDGLLYGLRPECRRNDKHLFCAIDGKSLDTVWEIPTTSSDLRTFKFTIVDKVIFTIENSYIDAYDKTTGVRISRMILTHQIPATESEDEYPISFFAADTAGILYIVHAGTMISTFNPQTNEETVIEADTKGRNYFVAGETFGYVNRYWDNDSSEYSIVLYPKNKPQHVIKMHIGKYISTIVMAAQAHNSQILYVDTNNDNNYELISFDTDTLTEKWRFPLSHELRALPCVSHDGQHIFMKTQNNNIISLKNDGDTVQFLWDFKIPNNDYSDNKCLALNAQGTILFYLDHAHKQLYKIDAITGTIISTTPDVHGQYLIGVSPEGLPYIFERKIYGRY
ncbi:MAG: hypothetical protein Q8Q60_01130, partial [Candidatus Chromulinivorax sp.]|nr:hypothetical protein [Candidatus Chromulinivorax sp.]